MQKELSKNKRKKERKQNENRKETAQINHRE
jgi:hypothetical protein